MDNLFGSKSVFYKKSFPTHVEEWLSKDLYTVEFMNPDGGRVEIELSAQQATDLGMDFKDGNVEYDIQVIITPRK